MPQTSQTLENKTINSTKQNTKQKKLHNKLEIFQRFNATNFKNLTKLNKILKATKKKH